MYFLRRIWLLQVITGMMLVAIQEGTGLVSPPSPIRALPGQTVKFTWTSDVKILEATWGIRSGSATADPQYIFVRAINETPRTNPALDPNLKSRIRYIGNLTVGHAWFALFNVTDSDSKCYVGLIREKDSNTMPYYVQLIVDSPSPTPNPTVYTTIPSTNYPGPTSSESSSTVLTAVIVIGAVVIITITAGLIIC